MHSRVETILADEGFIRAADHPRLTTTLSRLAREGLLANPLPGIYIAAGDPGADWLGAVCAWAAPSGTLHGRSAASLWLPELASAVAFIAHPAVRSRRGVEVCRRLVPPEHTLRKGLLQFAARAYAAVELACVDDGRAICEALRTGIVDQAALVSALATMKGSPGQSERRKVVADCADNPWSYAEKRLHAILRAGGICDWVANRPVWIGGRKFWPDVRMRSRKLVLEFDGREVHERSGQFLTDRERQNAFEADGYHMLRFGWEHLGRPDYVLAVTREGWRNASPY
jgi:very-short-patch-repair endonuclease